jgi:hypothetical protein
MRRLVPLLAGPLAVVVVAEALGLGDTDPATVLGWYAAIVGSVSALAGHRQTGTSVTRAEAQGPESQDQPSIRGGSGGSAPGLAPRATAQLANGQQASGTASAEGR